MGSPDIVSGTDWRSVGERSSAWFAVPRGGKIGVFVAGMPDPDGRPHRLLGSLQAPSCAAAGIRDRLPRIFVSQGALGCLSLASRHGERAAAPATPIKCPSREFSGDSPAFAVAITPPVKSRDDAVRPSAETPAAHLRASPGLLPHFP